MAFILSVCPTGSFPSKLPEILLLIAEVIVDMCPRIQNIAAVQLSISLLSLY